MTHASFLQPDMLAPERTLGAWPFGELEPLAYNLIMADPPWRFATYSSAGEEKSPQAQYATMTLDEIGALPVADLARENCLLWMWATAPMLEAQYAIVRRWGFEPKTSGVWIKKTVHGKVAFGTGYILRSSHEPFILAARGEPKTTRSERSALQAPLREHSRKPDEAYAMAERLMPHARRADLFARQRRPGWDGWGLELEKFQPEGGAAMTTLHYTGRTDGKRSSISVERDAKGIILAFRRDGEAVGLRIHADQARALARLLDKAADDAEPTPPLRNTRDDGGVL